MTRRWQLELLQLACRRGRIVDQNQVARLVRTVNLLVARFKIRRFLLLLGSPFPLLGSHMMYAVSFAENLLGLVSKSKHFPEAICTLRSTTPKPSLNFRTRSNPKKYRRPNY
eukprot:m.346053 g.346053  ORF g.346053 m.346053 type:complete len:112 (-) comp55824_c0_seq6:178-513(-)